MTDAVDSGGVSGASRGSGAAPPKRPFRARRVAARSCAIGYRARRDETRVRVVPDASASARTPQPRHSGVESDLQVVHLPQLVVHLQQAVDHGLDLLRHSIELLVRHACELTTDLFVERDDASEPPDLPEPTIDLLVRGEDAFELPAHVRIAGLDVLHDCPAELGTIAIEV